MAKLTGIFDDLEDDDDNPQIAGDENAAEVLKDFQDSMLDPTTTLISLDELRQDIFSKYGKQASEDFVNFSCTPNFIPENIVALESFLQGRTDYVSKACYQKLLEVKNNK